MESFWFSSLVAPHLELNCDFMPTSVCGSSKGICSWGCPGGRGSGPERTRCGGGMAAWIAGTLAAPGEPEATSTGHMALLGFFSSLWELTFKGLPWLILLYCSAHQALKGPLLLGSFFTAHLLLPACSGERGYGDGSSPCPWLSSSTLLPHPLSSKGIPHNAFPPSHLLRPSPHSQKQSWLPPGIALPSLPPAPSHCAHWWTCIPVLRYVGPWHGWSVWFSLHSECHRAAASLSDSQKCFPSVPTDCPGCRGISPASASQPSAAGLVPLSLLLSSFLHPTDLCVDPHISFQLSWTSDDISWCFMRTAASVDVFLMHPWKEICSISTYSSTIFSRNLCF